MTTQTGLYPAMAKAFAAMEGAKKDSDNEAFKRNGMATKYADLESVVAAIKPALVTNDLFFAQVTHEQQGGVCIETVVHHSSGESMSFGKVFVPVSKNDAHGYGSATSYARRYGLMTAFGICPEDDDGNAATANPPKADEQRKPVTINKDQLAKIQAEIDRTGTDPQAICKGYAVKAVAELSASQFADAMSVLRKRPNTIAASEEELNDKVPY